MEISQALQKKVSKAKIALLQQPNSIFLTTILFSLKQEWSTDIPTAYVDGVTLTINPDWFDKVEKDESLGLLAHESWHVAFNHMHRVGARDPKTFNQAADYVINNMLVANGFTLPKGALIDPQYDDMTTEQVYDLLIQNPPPETPEGGMGPDDIKPPGKEKSPAEIKEMQEKVKDIISKATMQAKLEKQSHGDKSGELDRLLDELLNPKLDWKVLLQNYMSSFQKEDYSFKRPNRRYMPEFYLPSLHSEALGEIAIAVDTSGSVSNEDFRMFLSEINYIKETLRPAVTTVIDFDTRINNVTKLSPDDPIGNVKFTGGGGTNLSPVFEYYDKQPPVVLIVFSDLWCNPIKVDPGYPTLWICLDNPKAKVHFGELIHFSTER